MFPLFLLVATRSRAKEQAQISEFNANPKETGQVVKEDLNSSGNGLKISFTSSPGLRSPQAGNSLDVAAPGSRSSQIVKQIKAVPRKTLNLCLDDLLKATGGSKGGNQSGQNEGDYQVEFGDFCEDQIDYDDDFFECMEQAQIDVNVVSEVDPNSEIKRAFGDQNKDANEKKLYFESSSDESDEDLKSAPEKERKCLKGSIFSGENRHHHSTKSAQGKQHGANLAGKGFNLNMKFIKNKLFTPTPRSPANKDSSAKPRLSEGPKSLKESPLEAINHDCFTFSINYNPQSGNSYCNTPVLKGTKTPQVVETSKIDETRRRSVTTNEVGKSFGSNKLNKKPPLAPGRHNN